MFVKAVFLCFLTVSIYAVNFTEELAEKVSNHILPLLEQNLIQKTQREQARLTIEYKVVETSLHFFLSKRSERDTLFSFTIKKVEDILLVEGRVLQQEEKQIIEHTIHLFFPKKMLQFEISVGPIGWGIVNKGVVNLYVNPIDEAGDNLASQLAYGTSILLVEKKNSFFRIQGYHDKYLGWMKISDFFMLTQEKWENWTSKIHVYTKSIVNLGESSIPTGSCFALSRFDKANVWVKDFHNREWKFPKNKLSSHLKQEQNIVKTARNFLPQANLATKKYLWGGTTTPQTDCSGFVQLTYRMHNILLPRDSDQQFEFSKKVRAEQAKAGDLIFFSKHGKHPTHVGLYIDNKTFIHCSASGPYSGVKINTLDGDSDYEKYLRKIYYGTGRIVK